MSAVVFDMDGVLVDSEPLWQRAEMDAFARVGVMLTPAMCAQTMGLRIDEVTRHWFARIPWEGPSVDEVTRDVLDRVCALIRDGAEPMPHARECVRRLRSEGRRLAVASSSPGRVIETVMERLGLRGMFDVVESAEHEPLGKPHPAVYLNAARALGVAPSSCVAIEDSVNGIIAAKAARMFCVAVPDRSLRGDKRLGIADAVVESLAELALPTTGPR